MATVLIAACGGSGATPTATIAPATASPAESPSPIASEAAASTPNVGPAGQATLQAAATVAAGAQFDVAWTGPNGPQDYEIWYASDRVEGTFKSIPIVVQ